jgi:TP901 family phage tail tape measure protein
MAEDAGSIFSEVRLRLDKLDADIKHAIGAMNEFGTKLVDISDRTANLFDKPYAQSIAKVEGYIRSLAAAAKEGAITEKAALEETIAVRKRQLDFIAASAAKQGGYTDKQIADVKSTRIELERLEKEYKDLGFSAEGAGKKQLDVFQKVASAIGSAAIINAFRVAIQGFADYDAALTDVAAATRATESELSALEDAARSAGKTLGFSAREGLKGIEALSKAGVSNADIMGGALTGALSLAAAGSLDVGVAAETAAAAMTQFGLSGQDAAHVADLLAAAAGKSQGEVSDYAQALNQVGLVASQTGLTIEETTAALAAFGSAGLKGSDAGTSFKTMLLSLNGTSDESKALMQELGISAFDAQGKFVGLEKFAGNLQDALKDMSAQQRNSTLQTIFGTDAIRAANVLYNQGAAGIREWGDKVNDAGFAAETARIKNESLEGHFKKLSSAAENASNSFVEKLSPALKGIADIGTDVLNFIAGLPGPVQGAIAVMIALGGAFVAAALAARGLGIALSASLGPIGIAVSLIGGIAAGIAAANAEAKEFRNNEAAQTFKSIAAQSGKTGEELTKFIEKLAEVDEFLRTFGRQFNAEGMRNFARDTGLTSKQFAELIILSKTATEEQKAYANSLLSTIAKENELNDIRRESTQQNRARIAAQVKANQEAEAKQIAALAGISAATEYQNKLVKLGILTEEEGLNNKIKLRQAEIDKIIETGEKSGKLSTAQVAEIQRLQGLNKENADSLVALQNNVSDANAGFANNAIEMQVAHEESSAAGVEAYKELSDAASESSTTSADAFDRYDKLRRESTVTTTAEVIQAQAEIDKATFDSFAKNTEIVKNYAATFLGIFQGLISALAELYAVDSENKLAAIQEQQDAALEALDEQLEARLVAAGVQDETAVQSAEKAVAILEKKLAEETDLKKKASLEEELIEAKKAVTKAKIEQDYADKVTKTNDEFNKKKAQQEYQGELEAWNFKLAAAIASTALASVQALATGFQAGFPAGVVLGPALATAATIAGGIQIAAVVAQKPKPPMQTGGIVLPQTGGVPVVAAENGSPELMLNGGASGQALLAQFAGMISDRIGSGGGAISLQLVVDGRVLAETTAPYFEKGIVRLKL